MGRNKMVVEETKAYLKIQKINQTNHQIKWANKKGVSYPLSPYHWQQYQLETLIEYRFQALKRLFDESDWFETVLLKNTSDSIVTPRYWPHMWFFGNGGDKCVMSDAEIDNSVSKIEDIINSSTPICTNSNTKLSLSPKLQSGEKSNINYAFNKATLMVSPSRETTKYLSIRTDTEYKATLYTGHDTIENDENSSSFSSVTAFLVVTDEDNDKHAVWLDEFNSLVEVEKDKKYVFTFYNRRKNVLFVKHLASLDDVDLFFDCDKILNSDSNELQALDSSNITTILTKREYEVMRLMLEDMLYIKIAEKLRVSLSVIHECKRSIYSKLKINSKFELISLLIKQAFSPSNIEKS